MSNNASVLIVTPLEAENIKKSFERNEKSIEEDVKIIRVWLKKQAHIPQDEDEDIIRRVLQFNKFSVERTKQKFDYYYAVKNFAPLFLQNCNPLHPSMQEVFKYGIFVPLPKLTPELARVSISALRYRDCPEFSSTAYFKSILAEIEVRLKFDNYMHDIIIIDLINTNLTNMMSMRPADITKVYSILQKAYSERIKGIHFMNAPSYAMGFINIFKRILSNKLGNRLHVHSNQESLYTFIPREILPKDYGGNEPTLNELNKNWVKFMENKDDWMLKRANMKSNEKLRIGKPLDIEVYGMEGTFRKINID